MDKLVRFARISLQNYRGYTYESSEDFSMNMIAIMRTTLINQLQQYKQKYFYIVFYV